MLFMDSEDSILLRYQFSPNIQSQCIPIKISWGIFVEIDKVILKFIWKDRELRITKTIGIGAMEVSIAAFQNN